MNPKHIHTPVSTRARCPVCRETVYSRGGIHPQCAVRQSEPVRVKTKAQDPSQVSEASETADPINVDIVSDDKSAD